MFYATKRLYEYFSGSSFGYFSSLWRFDINIKWVYFFLNCFKASVDRRMGESFFCLLPLVLLLGNTRNAPPPPCNRLLATIFRFRPYVIRDNGGQKISCKFNAKLRQLS